MTSMLIEDEAVVIDFVAVGENHPCNVCRIEPIRWHIPQQAIVHNPA